MKSQIDGLIIKTLERHTGETGDFREIIRHTDDGYQGFGQLSSSIVYEGIAKAWHLHKDQTESMTVLSGVVKFGFADRREDSKSFGKVEDYLIESSANPALFTVPPGVAHGYRVISGPAVICYLSNRTYDPNDQFKIQHDDVQIGYDWGPPAIL